MQVPDGVGEVEVTIIHPAMWVCEVTDHGRKIVDEHVVLNDHHITL